MPHEQPVKIVERGVKRRSVAGTAVFLGLRSLDIPLQYKLLTGEWSLPLLSRIGLRPCAAVLAPRTTTGIAAVDRLGLTNPTLLLLAMAVGAAAKQCYWLTAICNEEFGPRASLIISAFNTAFNSINSMMLMTSLTSAANAWPGQVEGISAPMAVGAVLYVTGMYLEVVSEIQRRAFKENPKTKGKVCRTGLWRVARHINYGGYALWRSGYSLAAGGWVWGAMSAVFNLSAFIGSSIPELGSYMDKRYGREWQEYCGETRWVILPGFY